MYSVGGVGGVGGAPRWMGIQKQLTLLDNSL